MANDQRDFWNGEAGEIWVAQQDAFDTLMQPVLDGLLRRAALLPGARVLDVGCGTGLSSLHAAAAVGPSGHVAAVDISAPMLSLAAKRTQDIPNITLLEANAAAHPFDPASFDNMISRFGVMFFGETEAAFAHLHTALKPGARYNSRPGAQSPKTPGSPCRPRPPRPSWAHRPRLIPMHRALSRCATRPGPAQCSAPPAFGRSRPRSPPCTSPPRARGTSRGLCKCCRAGKTHGRAFQRHVCRYRPYHRSARQGIQGIRDRRWAAGAC